MIIDIQRFTSDDDGGYTRVVVKANQQEYINPFHSEALTRYLLGGAKVNCATGIMVRDGNVSLCYGNHSFNRQFAECDWRTCSREEFTRSLIERVNAAREWVAGITSSESFSIEFSGRV